MLTKFDKLEPGCFLAEIRDTPTMNDAVTEISEEISKGTRYKEEVFFSANPWYPYRCPSTVARAVDDMEGLAGFVLRHSWKGFHGQLEFFEAIYGIRRLDNELKVKRIYYSADCIAPFGGPPLGHHLTGVEDGVLTGMAIWEQCLFHWNTQRREMSRFWKPFTYDLRNL